MNKKTLFIKIVILIISFTLPYIFILRYTIFKKNRTIIIILSAIIIYSVLNFLLGRFYKKNIEKFSQGVYKCGNLWWYWNMEFDTWAGYSFYNPNIPFSVKLPIQEAVVAWNNKMAEYAKKICENGYNGKPEFDGVDKADFDAKYNFFKQKVGEKPTPYQQGKDMRAGDKDCVIAPWKDVGTCSKGCKGGLQKQTTTVISQPQNDGKACPTEYRDWSLIDRELKDYLYKPVNGDYVFTTRYIPCNENISCDCELGDWTSDLNSEPEFSDSLKQQYLNGNCDTWCGTGKRWEIRPAIRKVQEGGSCPLLLSGERLRQVPCNTQPCPPTDCVLGNWQDAGECNKSCGGGKRIQIRNKIIPEANGGGCADPNSAERKREVDCNTQPCNCILSDWVDKGNCTKSCGGGKQLQVKNVLQASTPGGQQCPDRNSDERKRTVDCNVNACSNPKESKDLMIWRIKDSS